MDNLNPDSWNPASSIQPGGMVPSRAGVLVDPMPLPGKSSPLRTDISQDLLEQRSTQEQAKLLERFKLLREWQQQQQNQLMLQQQQQLELLRNQQEMVQQALMQQRLKQWGGGKVTYSPPKSPSNKHSPKKSPTSSLTRGTKVPSSVPINGVPASVNGPVSQNGHVSNSESSEPNQRRDRPSDPQEEVDLDSDIEHVSSLSVEGVYPLPDTASETSDAGHNDHHDDRSPGIDKDAETPDDEIFGSVSEFPMTPTISSPHEVHHLSIRLPDTGRTDDSFPPQSPGHYPSSMPNSPSSPAISPQLSPFTPTTPSHQGQSRDTVGRGAVEQGENEGGESILAEERPIQSQLGVEFKSFEELVELQIKRDNRTLPLAPASSTTSEQTTGRPRHSFLKRGEGISRFGMKPRKYRPRKEKSVLTRELPDSNIERKKPSPLTDGSSAVSKAKNGGGKSKGSGNKKKQSKKEDVPKLSRKVSSKPLQQPSQDEVQVPEHIFKQPHPVARNPPKTKTATLPVERERLGVTLQHRLMVPSLDLPYSSQSEHDDTMEASFVRRTKMWEKKTKLEQEDLDEFEMLEEAADDNVSFCSEASLVINVLQRAQRRKQELLGISPLKKKKSPLATLQSVDTAEENEYESHDIPPDPLEQSPDSPPEHAHVHSRDSLLMKGDFSVISNGNENVRSVEQSKDTKRINVASGKPSVAVHMEKVHDGAFTLRDGEIVEIRDDFYSSDEHTENEDEENVTIQRTLMRKVSKRISQKDVEMDYLLNGKESERQDGLEENGGLDRLLASDNDELDIEEDIDIYRTKESENTNNNSNKFVRHETLHEQDSHMSNLFERTPSSAKAAKSSQRTQNGSQHKGHSAKKRNMSNDFEEDFEGTPRKTVESPEATDQVEFEDEETWGDFMAHLSDSSDEDSIIAMAPYLVSTPSKAEDHTGMTQKKLDGRDGDEAFLSPPPTSALVAKLFPKLKQPDEKKKQQIEQKEKVLHAKAERPSGDGSQARLLKDKLTQLENEIERFRKENLLLAKLREEREKALESMKKEMEEFQKQKADELQRLQEFKDEETKKLKRERKMFEKHQKSLRAMPDKRDREEIEMLKQQLSELQMELKQRESRWNASTRRLKDRTVALETENTELREEIRILEQRRLAAWKNDESNKGKAIYAHPTSKPRLPSRPQNAKVEQSNNNNINKKRPGSEDHSIQRNGDGHHHRGSGKSRTMSESSDDDDSDNEYLQAYPAPRMEPSKLEDSLIYESQITNPRRSRSPSDRERLPIPIPNERTPPPSSIKPSSLSPSSPSTTQPTPRIRSPQHPSHAKPRASPHRHMQNGHGLNHVGAGVDRLQHPGGSEEEDNGDYEVMHGEGKVEEVKADGSRTLTFSNGTRKEISADGKTIIISFFNGDVKQILPDQRVVYYYSETKTTHTTYQDGLEILQFSNNQTEKHYPDGTKEITFPDQTIKYLFPNGGEESVFPDGTVLRVEPNGHRVMEFPNGQREIHTEQYKRREYPDGTMKTVYPDGRQETRYSSGRIRIKDKAGNIVVDRKA